MSSYPVIVFLVIMCHCCVLSIFATEWYKPGTAPYGTTVICAYNNSPVASIIYSICMLITIFLLTFYFGSVLEG